MRYYYAFTTKGFYNDNINEVPDDAVELREGDYDRLIDGLSNLMDIVDVEGYPTLIERPPQSDHEKASADAKLTYDAGKPANRHYQTRRRRRLRQGGAHPATGRQAALPLRADARAGTSWLA